MTSIPDTWILAPIGDLCDLVNGRAFKPGDWSKTGLPIVRIQNLNNSDATFNYFDGEVRERFLIDTGDLLFAWSGTPGTSFGAHVWHGGQAVLNQHIFKVIFNKDHIDRDFFRLAINQTLEELIGKAHGGVGLRHVTKGKFEETRIALPPLAEQRRIAAKVAALKKHTEAARQELKQVAALLIRHKQSVLHSAFTGALTSRWRASRKAVEIVQSDSGGLWSVPSGWSWCAVKDVGQVSIGRQRSPENHRGPNMRPYVRSANITWEGWNLSDVKLMNFNSADFERCKLEVGDVLLNEGSGSAKEVGKPAIWRGEIKNCCFQNTLIRVRPSGCTSEYLYFYFLFSALTSRFVPRTQGVSIVHIGKEGISKYPIPIPSIDEQTEIALRLKDAFGWLGRTKGEQEMARLLLDRLDKEVLEKAFRGELLPQDSSDEAADALFRRIREERVERKNVLKLVPKKTIRRKYSANKRGLYMTKKRMDVSKDHLRKTLEGLGGSAPAKDLWQHSEMDIDEFYKLLRDEMKGGHIQEGGSKDELVLNHAA